MEAGSARARGPLLYSRGSDRTAGTETGRYTLGPDNEDRQVGGNKKWRSWRPSAGGVKNAVPLANPWPSVRITKAIIRG